MIVKDKFANVTELERPFGGSIVTPETVPFVALVLGNNTGSVCTGSLIALDLVLTLARCLFVGSEQKEDESSLRVLAGVANLGNVTAQASAQEGVVSKLIIHPSFKMTPKDPSFGYNDIALIQLKRSLAETESVNVVPVGVNDWREKPTLPCRMAGFSAVNPLSNSPDDDHLKMHEVVAAKTCNCHKSLRKHFGFRIHRWLCLVPEKGVGPCVGSAGSGLVCNDHLIGINVGIIPFQDLKQCIYLHSPLITCDTHRSLAVFLDICPFLPWIHFHFREVPAGPIDCSRDVSIYDAHQHIIIIFILVFIGTHSIGVA